MFEPRGMRTVEACIRRLRQPAQRRERPDEKSVDCLSFPYRRNAPAGGGGGNGCRGGARH
jgi:hypothetical protein